MKIVPELVVVDVRKAIDFYQTFFDFELVDKVEVKDSYFWVKMESKDKSTEIMLTLLTNVNDEIPEMKKRHDAGRMILSVEIDDINYFYSKFKKTNFILKDLYKTDYGTTEFVVKDVDGYILDVIKR
jgi:uncharacterized glyoxalase superfamily protein PhnB